MNKAGHVLLFLVMAIGLPLAAAAQKDTIKAPYLKFPTVPPFDLLQPDNNHLTKDKMPKSKMLLMYFSPTCDHCKHQTEDLLKDIDQFKDVQIVMATYQPMEELITFYQTYKLGNYPNIRVGRDTKFFLPPFFKMQNLPYLALYDKAGNLLTIFDGNRPVKKILTAFAGK
jgi:thioredoxin-related protein